MSRPASPVSIPGIYVIVNERNGKQYVGQAQNMRVRWSKHLWALRRQVHDNEHLQAAFNLYSEAAFRFDVLEPVSDLSQLDAREQHYIDTLRPVYNKSPTGGNCRGVKHTAETRAKLSAIHMGKPKSAETRLRMSKPKSPEHARHIGDAHRGKVISQEQREKIRAKLKGRPLPPEHRAKVVAAQRETAAKRRGMRHTDETRAKISASLRSSDAFQQAVKRVAEQNRGRKQSVETRAKISAAMKGLLRSAEYCAKTSEAQTRRRKRERAACTVAGPVIQSFLFPE